MTTHTEGLSGLIDGRQVAGPLPDRECHTPAVDVIFLMGADGRLAEMRPAPYDRESVLQQLLADHPNLLVGGDSESRLLLIAQEHGVPDSAGGYDRWSLDHLFVDDKGVPTLVEVKRSTDTRIRREVVGQMLDYAANGVKHWPEGSLKERFETTAGGPDQAQEQFDSFLPDHDMPEFWDQVETNLRAGLLRLVFVADVIPDTLRRIIEFLNEQMDRTEVIGVEVQQYLGGGQMTLVPRLIGRTTAAQRIKPRTGSYPDELAAAEPDVRDAEARLVGWAERDGVQMRLTRHAKQFTKDGMYLFQYYPTYGTLEIPIQRFSKAGLTDLHQQVRAEFQALTSNRLSQKHLILPATDLVRNWSAFSQHAVPHLVEALRQLPSLPPPSPDTDVE